MQQESDELSVEFSGDNFNRDKRNQSKVRDKPTSRWATLQLHFQVNADFQRLGWFRDGWAAIKHDTPELMMELRLELQQHNFANQHNPAN